jgi:ferredoxin-NADP reductase
MSSASASSAFFISRLLERREVAERTMAFLFEKPAGFTFRPGQFLEIALIDPPETDGEGNSRAFSIASAPHESTLMVATRLRDTAFKRTLERVPLKTGVRIEGPFGDLHLHNNAKRPAVFLAGGIGITPIRSIVADAAKQKLPHRIFLIYSNRRPEDAPFLRELTALEHENPNYRFIPTMTEMERSRAEWKGERGQLTPEMLTRSLQGAASREPAPVFYITGPPGMVKAYRTVLDGAGADEDNIRTEEFSGY